MGHPCRVAFPIYKSVTCIMGAFTCQSLLNYSENRYLLFLTENYAALDILEHYLEVGSGSNSQTEENTSDVEDEISSKPFTLFGSSFPKDKDYTQVRIVSLQVTKIQVHDYRT